jgi:putative ATP-dependent endonuclease of OLD family
MRLEHVSIHNYRSIEHIELYFPHNKPVVLFGPNNAGKSNILSAINRLLGERYPTYIEMLDSDYFKRDKTNYPTTEIYASFDEPLFYNRYKNIGYRTIGVQYDSNNPVGNILCDEMGNKIYPSNEDRSRCQSYLIDAERNIQSAFNYSSRYSLLSKFSHKIHSALSTEHKDELSQAFKQIKESFEQTEEFSNFFEEFSASLIKSVKGFVHSLAVDFSAYDPNNYAKSLRIYAREGDNIRGFEEFGTGEQQVLLMAFVKAYMKVFTSENFILIIEEPEAHLHPLAQRWLKEYIVEMCASGVQIIISTHSTDFIDADYIDGLVRVYKVGGITQIKQLSSEELCDFCIESGVPEEKTSPENIVEFYSTKLFADQLRGVFAETIIFVEGATEFYSLPIYLKRNGFSLAEHGVEIIDCKGKESIPLFWRLFKAYGYNCYAIFDCDAEPMENQRIFDGLIEHDNWITNADEFLIEWDFAYFGKDFESYFRSAIDNYDTIEAKLSLDYQISSKPGKAKAVAQHCNEIPDFIKQLTEKLEIVELLG